MRQRSRKRADVGQVDEMAAPTRLSLGGYSMKRVAVVCAAVLILALVASAQDGVRIVRTGIHNVHSEMVDEWIALQKVLDQ